MVVTLGTFDSVINLLSKERFLGLDTETTGLRMYHGDRLFSIIISTDTEAYYFNFKHWDIRHDKENHVEFRFNVDPNEVLNEAHLEAMSLLWLDDGIKWAIQNAANFDMGILGVEGIELAGEIHCTKAIGRVEWNDHRDVKTDPKKKAAKAYSLEAQLFRRGHHKDDKVAEYIDEHKLKSTQEIPGKDTPYEKKHFDQVPMKIMVPYACTDSKETLFLAKDQIASIQKQDLMQEKLGPERSVQAVMRNENRLQKTIYRMRHKGVLVDIPYCQKASAYEKDRSEKAAAAFKKETGRDYSASPTLFKTVFAEEKDLWGYTEKGNPSFDSDYLARFTSPAARAVLDIRDAKSKSDFYNGFLWFADSRGVVHTNLNPEGAAHGRFSSSEPNLQNLTSEDSDEEIAQEFVVRRAIVPRPGFVFYLPDFSLMEYRFMLDLACQLVGELTPLGKLVQGGLDFHEGTVQAAAKHGSTIFRKQAKIANFLNLYGGGIPKLAEALKIKYEEAAKIKYAIAAAAPEIKMFTDGCMRSAEQRGYTINWLGRRCQFPNKAFSYRAPNYIVSGGCADSVKIAMNRIDEYLLTKKSSMVLSIHDELPIEIHESEFEGVPQEINNIMENSYVGKYISQKVEAEWSEKSLADKRKGFPGEFLPAKGK